MKADRNIRCLVCTVIAVLRSLVCLSQESISGKVTDDADGQPVAGVFISFLKERVMVGYCYSENDGTFRFEFLQDQRPDAVGASLLGYSSFRQEITKSFIEIRLKEKKLALDAAVVSGSVMEVKGDTVSYTVGAFREKEDIVIADVLKRLPGISVTESGGIIHNGTHINKFYIEGMDLLGGRYGIATNNLSADDISHIEVYQNHQPVKALKGVVMTDRSAVNIILKETARNSWMFSGDLALGYSSELLFDTKALVTRFSKKRQDLYLLKGNNVGADIFNEIREQEYFGRTGAFLVSEGNTDSDFQSALNPRRNTLELPKHHWYDNLSGLGSFNHLRAAKNDLQIRTSVQLAAERYSEESGYMETVSTGDSEVISINEESSQLDKRYYFNLTTSFEKNVDKKYWTDDIRISGQFRDNVGVSLGGSEEYSQAYTLPSLKVENRYRAVIRRADNRTIDIASETSVVQNSHSAGYVTDFADARQTLSTFRFKSINRVNYGFRVGGLLLNAMASLDLNHISRTSELDWDFDGSSLLAEKYNPTEVKPGVVLSTTIGKGNSQFKVNVPVHLQMIFADVNKVYPSVAPSFIYRWKISQDWSLNATAQYQTGGSSIESLGNAVVMSDYRRLSLPLGVQRSSVLMTSAGFRYANNPAMLYVSLNGDYSRRSTDKTSSNTYYEEYTLTRFVEVPMIYSRYGVRGNVSKHFGLRALVVELDADWHSYDSREFLQGSYLDYKGDQTDLALLMRSSPARWINADVSLSYTIDRVYGETTDSQHRISSEASVSLKPLKPLVLNGNVFYLWYSSSDMQNDPIISVSASWSFRRFSIFAECRNLLDVNELRKEYIHPYRIIKHTSSLRGREYLSGIRMSL